MSNPLNSSGIYIVTVHTATWHLKVTLERSAIFFLKAECLANCFLCSPLTPQSAHEGASRLLTTPHYAAHTQHVRRKAIKFKSNYELFYCDIDIKTCMKSNATRNQYGPR